MQGRRVMECETARAIGMPALKDAANRKGLQGWLASEGARVLQASRLQGILEGPVSKYPGILAPDLDLCDVPGETIIAVARGGSPGIRVVACPAQGTARDAAAVEEGVFYAAGLDASRVEAVQAALRSGGGGAE